MKYELFCFSQNPTLKDKFPGQENPLDQEEKKPSIKEDQDNQEKDKKDKDEDEIDPDNVYEA